MITKFVIIIIFIELIAFIILKSGKYPGGKINKLNEFPPISEVILNKFVNWDPVLGWSPKPGLKKRDNTFGYRTDKEPVYYSIDEFGSRNPYKPSHPNFKIACYGDSYCFCREVNDDETWPWLLGEAINSRVSNYGAGNYGLDQALLRLEEKDPKENSDIVIMAITSVTIERIISVYKHYIEPGNTLAVKPRFIINNIGNLELIPYPFKNKSDLLHLKSFKDHFHRFDGNYSFWKKKRATFPYLISIFYKGWYRVLLFFLLSKLSFFLNLDDKFKEPLEKYLKPKRVYKNIDHIVNSWKNESELFVKLVEKFNEYGRTNKIKVVFLLQHHKRWVHWCKENPRPYAESLEVIKKNCPDLVILDSMDWLINYDNDELNSMYSDVGSHHSIKGNQLIADQLKNCILTMKH